MMNIDRRREEEQLNYIFVIFGYIFLLQILSIHPGDRLNLHAPVKYVT